MNRFLRPLAFFFTAALMAALSSCAIMQTDSPNATATVRASSERAVETAAISAFEERGFRWKGTVASEVTFERPLNKTDEVLYGTWGDEKSIERVVVRITRAEDDTFKVACFPYTIRNPNSGMEDISRRMSVHSKTYSAALKDMRRALKP